MSAALQMESPLAPAWRITIEPRDDGRIGVCLAGEGWTVATSYPTHEQAQQWALAELAKRNNRDAAA